MNKKTLWITETAVMIALLVALQWATKPLGQFVTGSCVNLVLGVSVLVGGLWCGLTVALVSPFFAFLLGIGPAFLPIVPMVAVGNMVLVVIQVSGPVAADREAGAAYTGTGGKAGGGNLCQLLLAPAGDCRHRRCAGRDHRPPDPQGPALQVRTYQPSFNGKQPAGVTGRLFFACQDRRLKNP